MCIIYISNNISMCIATYQYVYIYIYIYEPRDGAIISQSFVPWMNRAQVRRRPSGGLRLGRNVGQHNSEATNASLCSDTRTVGHDEDFTQRRNNAQSPRRTSCNRRKRGLGLLCPLIDTRSSNHLF